MILRKATEKDKPRIESAWRSIFSHDDHGHSNYYFKFAYDEDQSYVLTTDQDELVSSAQVHTKTLVLAQKVIEVSFIVGIFTMPQYRKQGYMKQMLTQILEIEEHKHHFTLIQAYDPTLYLPYGFEPIYERSIYSLEPSQVPVISPSGVSYQVDETELLSLYKNFIKHFDGTVRRDLEDFKRLSLEISAQNGKIIGFINNHVLEAYACILFEEGKVILDEVVYLNAHSLLKLLNSITSINKPIEIRVSPKENLKKVLPLASVENQVYTYVRLNDAKLFNELYKVNIASAKEAFLLAEKSLWIRENQ